MTAALLASTACQVDVTATEGCDPVSEAGQADHAHAPPPVPFYPVEHDCTEHGPEPAVVADAGVDHDAGLEHDGSFDDDAGLDQDAGLDDDAGHEPLPVVTRPIPVLLYHGVCPEECAPDAVYDVTQAELDATLTAMAERGYTTMSIADYAAWFTGAKELTGRPVLMTFDDGRRVAYELADPVLAKHGARATMYIITSFVRNETPTPGDRFMSWSQIQEAYASGRWDIDLHAHAGHSKVEIGKDGNGARIERPFYANRSVVDGATESFDDWRARVVADLDTGEALLAARLPGRTPSSFALPFGDFGQIGTNDPAIPPAFADILDARYPAWFVQPSVRELPTPLVDPLAPPSPRYRSGRYTITRTTTTAQVLGWLDAAYGAAP